MTSFQGNPGLAGFYIPFLTHIHRSLKGSAVIAHSLVGHCPEVGPVPNARCGLHSQVEAVIEMIDAVRKSFSSSVHLVLVGHSVGAWLVLQVGFLY